MSNSTSSESKPQLQLDPTLVLTILTLIGGLLLAGHEFRTPRPAGKSIRTHMSVSEQRHDLSILEDPFALFWTDPTDAELEKYRGELPQEIRSRQERNTAGDANANNVISVVLVTVPGGASSEDREARIRARHAVVAGLTETGFAPDHADKIGLWETTNWTATVALKEKSALTNGCSPTNNSSRRLFLPFEGFSRSFRSRYPTNVETTDVVVVWLDEEMLSGKPMQRLEAIANQIRCALPSETKAPPSGTNMMFVSAHFTPSSASITASFTNVVPVSPNAVPSRANAAVRVTLLGPYSSETLREILEDIHDPGAPIDGATNKLDSIIVALPRASTSKLLNEEERGLTLELSRDAVRERLTANPKHGFNTAFDLAVPDSALAVQALEELKARDVDLETGTADHVVVIADATTMIGRSLPDLFSNVLLQRQLSAHRSDSLTDARHPGARNLHVFTFLAGLDGGAIDAQEKDDGGRDHGKRESTDYRSAAERINRRANLASGPNQMDSLERLADNIERLDENLRSQSDGAVRAVVIGGGDINDTLLILRAVRSRLPFAVFVTTELDARLWEPEEWDYTHNMVVVSGYGLELNPNFQTRVGSFRDSRQTALFAGTLLACGDTQLKNLVTGGNGLQAQRYVVAPRTFEIGRKGPLDVAPIPSTERSPSIHPTVEEGFAGKIAWKRCLIVILLMGSILALACYTSQFIRSIRSDRCEYLAEPLWLREEDLGGNRGLWHIRNQYVSSRRNTAAPKEPADAKCLEILKKALNNHRLINEECDAGGREGGPCEPDFRDPHASNCPPSSGPTAADPTCQCQFSASDVLNVVQLRKFITATPFLEAYVRLATILPEGDWPSVEQASDKTSLANLLNKLVEAIAIGGVENSGSDDTFRLTQKPWLKEFLKALEAGRNWQANREAGPLSDHVGKAAPQWHYAHQLVAEIFRRNGIEWTPPSLPSTVCFVPADVTEAKGILEFFKSKRFYIFYSTLIKEFQTPAKGANTDDISEIIEVKCTNENDVSKFLNNILVELAEGGFGAEDAYGARKLKATVWASFLKAAGKSPDRIYPETIVEQSETMMAEENRWIYSRLLIQEIVAPFVATWNLYFLYSKMTLNVANELNLELLRLPLSGSPDLHPSEGERTVDDPQTLDRIISWRRRLDALLDRLSYNYYRSKVDGDVLPKKYDGKAEKRWNLSSVPKAAEEARAAAWRLFSTRRIRLRTLQILFITAIISLAIAAIYFTRMIVRENGGFLSGTSIFPTLLGLGVTIFCSLVFLVESYLQLSEVALTASRTYRLPLDVMEEPENPEWKFWPRLRLCFKRWSLPAVPEHQSPVDASALWRLYQRKAGMGPRLFRIVRFILLYFLATMAYMFFAGHGVNSLPPLRANEGRAVHFFMSYGTFLVFLTLAFWTVDSAMLCGWFIKCLTQGPTTYPSSTIKMLRDRHGLIDERLIADYVDVKLIDQITRGIGTMLYFPATSFLFLMLSYNTITYMWPWPLSWFIVSVAHFLLAVYSILVLQRAAKSSRDKSVAALDNLLYHARINRTRSAQDLEHAVYQEAEDMVNEVRSLKGGAFVGLAGNPVIGASLLPIAGAILVALLQRWMSN